MSSASADMFDHIKFGVSDYATSKAFFLGALASLGIAVASEGPPAYGLELCGDGADSLCLFQTGEKPTRLHLAFAANDAEQVRAFYRAALEHGGRDDGAPGLRWRLHPDDDVAFVIGPDGHTIEVVWHKPRQAESRPAHLHEVTMFDHLGYGVSDLAASKRFFVAALAPLGIGVVMEGESGIGMGKHGKPSLWLAPGHEKPSPMHIAFTAATRADVDAFHRAALAVGGKDNGAPGLRSQYHANYYGAFVICPDGHNIEAVCHKAES